MGRATDCGSTGALQGGQVPPSLLNNFRGLWDGRTDRQMDKTCNATYYDSCVTPNEQYTGSVKIKYPNTNITISQKFARYFCTEFFAPLFRRQLCRSVLL